MSPKPYRKAVQGLVLDTVWSLWTELGAGGWSRRHESTAIDVEPLIIATAHPQLQATDPRLVEQALDWSVANIRLVSAIRLRHLLDTFSPNVIGSFGSLAAAVRREAHASWPGDGEAVRIRRPVAPSRTGNSPVADLSRRSLIQLRLRAAWGVSARAEIVRLMLAEPNRFLGVSELAAGAAFGRDNVADAVELMVRAGIVRERGAGGWRQYQLAARDPWHKMDHDPWEELLGPLPETFPDWPARFRIMLAILELAEADIPDPLVRATEITKFRRERAQDIARNSIVFAIPQPGPEGNEPNEAFEEQTLRVLRHWSAAPPAPDSPAVSRARTEKR